MRLKIKIYMLLFGGEYSIDNVLSLVNCHEPLFSSLDLIEYPERKVKLRGISERGDILAKLYFFSPLVSRYTS